MNRFGKSQRTELTRIFSELADLIHANNMERIVGVGPSVYPYTIALKRAYVQRYGKRARQLSVVNLGRLGEGLGEATSSIIMADKLIKPLQRRLSRNSNANSLLLEDVIVAGWGVSNIARVFDNLRIPNMTAALLQVRPKPHLTFSPHYTGADVERSDSLHRAIFLSRGRRFSDSTGKKVIRPPVQWAAKMREIHNELREIANSVPRKEQK